jgi:hypothetical protein
VRRACRHACRIGALIVALAAVCSCSDNPASAPPRLETEATRDFEAAWAAANARYPLFDFKNIDWNEVHTRYRPRAEQTAGLAIYDLLSDLIGELKDAHAYYLDPLLTPLHPFTPARIIQDYNAFSLDVVKTYFTGGLLLAGHGRISYGVTGGNTGYIHISTLAENGMMDDFDTVMDYVEATAGLIVDVRGNLGGNTANTQALIGRFLESPLESFGAFTVDGPVVLPPYEPAAASYTYTNPVVVLVNGACASAPEALAELMKRLPFVTLIGDTTAGAGCWTITSAPGSVTLPSGKVVFIPTTAMVRFDGQPLEWNGIPPDVRVEQSPSDIAGGHDKQLEAAIAYLE